MGRKGSGKTALFVQLRDTKRERKPNIVVDLKPEGYQLVDQGVDDNEARTDLEPAWPGCPGTHQQGRQRHGHDLVGNPIDIPQRVDQGGPGFREVCSPSLVGELPINPPNNVATGCVADKQE